jgi:hypothetical protein
VVSVNAISIDQNFILEHAKFEREQKAATDLEERGDAGRDVGEVDEQHDEAARERRLLPAAPGDDVHGGVDGAERDEAGGEGGVLAEVDERVRRGLPRAAPRRGGQQAEQRRQRAVGARRERPEAVLPAREPTHDVHGRAPHLRVAVREETDQLVELVGHGGGGEGLARSWGLQETFQGPRCVFGGRRRDGYG